MSPHTLDKTAFAFPVDLDSIVDAGKKHLTAFQDFCRDNVKDFLRGVKRDDIMVGNVKSRERIQTKADSDYGGDITQVKDVLRAYVFVQEPNAFLKTQNKLADWVNGRTSFENKKNTEIVPTRLKSKFHGAAEGGIDTVIVNFTFNGVPAELQVVQAKDRQRFLESHEAYIKQRACERVLTAGSLGKTEDPRDQVGLMRALARLVRHARETREDLNLRAK